MAEYISRAALMGELTSSDMQQKIKAMDGADAYNEFLMMVNGTEKADVAEVRHGTWRRGEYGVTLFCSECQLSSLPDWTGDPIFSPYCPRCGAKMDGGAE